MSEDFLMLQTTKFVGFKQNYFKICQISNLIRISDSFNIKMKNVIYNLMSRRCEYDNSKQRHKKD